MVEDLLPAFVAEHFEVHEWRHAGAILKYDYLREWQDIMEVLTAFRLLREEVLTPGGNDSPIAKRLNGPFRERGWVESGFMVRHLVEQRERREGSRVMDVVGQRELDSSTHKVDCFRNEVAVEVEWNNKDPFFARDLSNFRLLYDLRAVSVGVIITRCDDLQAIFNALGRGSSYGASTTHMSKLLPLLYGGGAGGCPVLVFGMSSKLYVGESLP